MMTVAPMDTTGSLVVAEGAEPLPPLPAWRGMLEERWHRRLCTLTELALAYHAAEGSAGRDPRDRDPGDRAETARIQRLQRLLREATAARRALGDTEEALARLSDGSFGRCEQCSGPIAAAELLAEPETRYCARCVQAASWIPGVRQEGGRGQWRRP